MNDGNNGNVFVNVIGNHKCVFIFSIITTILLVFGLFFCKYNSCCYAGTIGSFKYSIK